MKKIDAKLLFGAFPLVSGLCLVALTACGGGATTPNAQQAQSINPLAPHTRSAQIDDALAYGPTSFVPKGASLAQVYGPSSPSVAIKYPSNGAMLSTYSARARTASVQRAYTSGSPSGNITTLRYSDYVGSLPAQSRSMRLDTSPDRVVYVVTNKITTPIHTIDNETITSGVTTTVLDAASGDLLAVKVDGTLAPK